jgi:type VI protein secretion system component VasA
MHLALAVLFGAVMTYFFGLVSWNRMERLYAEATARTADAPWESKSGGSR